LETRVAVAEKLVGTKKQPDPGFGSGGGKGNTGAGGLIPSNVTSLSEYHTWIANLGGTNEGRVLLSDRTKMAQVRAEALANCNK
jgi:hypothetical protein